MHNRIGCKSLTEINNLFPPICHYITLVAMSNPVNLIFP